MSARDALHAGWPGGWRLVTQLVPGAGVCVTAGTAYVGDVGEVEELLPGGQARCWLTAWGRAEVFARGDLRRLQPELRMWGAGPREQQQY